MRRKTTKRAGKMAVVASALGFTATMFTAAPAHASCQGDRSSVYGGENDGALSYRLERWTGSWAHRTNCRVVVPAEQIVESLIHAVFI
jgi:hypothetical protein